MSFSPIIVMVVVGMSCLLHTSKATDIPVIDGFEYMGPGQCTGQTRCYDQDVSYKSLRITGNFQDTNDANDVATITNIKEALETQGVFGVRGNNNLVTAPSQIFLAVQAIANQIASMNGGSYLNGESNTDISILPRGQNTGYELALGCGKGGDNSACTISITYDSTNSAKKNYLVFGAADIAAMEDDISNINGVSGIQAVEGLKVVCETAPTGGKMQLEQFWTPKTDKMLFEELAATCKSLQWCGGFAWLPNMNKNTMLYPYSGERPNSNDKRDAMLSELWGGTTSTTAQLQSYGVDFETVTVRTDSWNVEGQDFCYKKTIDPCGGFDCSASGDFFSVAGFEVTDYGNTCGDCDTHTSSCGGTCMTTDCSTCHLCDTGICDVKVEGCTDTTAFNYNSNANFDDNTCEAVVNGCTDTAAVNYNSNANTDDGMCDINCVGEWTDWTLRRSYTITTKAKNDGVKCTNTKGEELSSGDIETDTCPDQEDLNGDESVNVLDVIVLVERIVNV